MAGRVGLRPIAGVRRCSAERCILADHRLDVRLRLVEHASELADVVRLGRHLDSQDDLIGRHHRLCVVALHPAAARLHDAAVRIGPTTLGPEVSVPAAPAENTQTRAAFLEEARRIAEATPSIRWHRPSRHEGDEAEPIPVFSDPEFAEAPVPAIEIAGSATRGVILHKLMEEVLTGETQDAAPDLESRATELLAQLGREPSVDPKFGIAPKRARRNDHKDAEFLRCRGAADDLMVRDQRYAAFHLMEQPTDDI